MLKFDTEYQEVVDFYINEEKRTVTAVLTVPSDIVVQEMMNIMNKASGTAFTTTDVVLKNGVLLNGTYRGTAHCHTDDTFDEEKGMRIAKLKALKAYYKDRNVVSARLQKIAEDTARRMAVATQHNTFSIEHIDELLAEC